MSMDEAQHTFNLNIVSNEIKALAKQAYHELIAQIGNGKEAASVTIARVLKNYSADVQTAVDSMMREYLSLGTPNNAPLATVNGIALSESLYANSMAVIAPNVIKIINDANSQILTARDIAKQLYEGYDFKDDPLKVTKQLPSYLFKPMARLTASGLKTPALRAAYLQYLDKQGKQANEAQLQKLLQTAFYERNRYLANRIAQTELHRVHTDTIATEIMTDDELHWVQIKLSSTHPKYDICDYHTNLNAYGKGKGVYPKAKAPKPPFHPHCRCRMSRRYDLDAPDKEPVPNKSAERTFIGSLSKSNAIAILGSEAKYFEYRQNKTLNVLDIVDRGKPKGYETKTIGGGVYDAEMKTEINNRDMRHH